jgi:formimidoylglutamate deiminase
MQNIVLDHVLTPLGWRRDVGLDILDGVIVRVVPDADGADRERIRGISLPGLPNLHSHTFQRAMAGLAEIRGPNADSFWTWREVMYHFLGNLSPEDVEAIAAYAFMEMLEGGFTSVAEFHYLHHDASGLPYADLAEMSHRIAAAAGATGIGLTLLPVFYAQGGFGAQPPTAGQTRFINDPDRFARLVEGAREAVGSLTFARLGVAPHSLRAVTPESLRDVVRIAGENPIHMHIAEQTKEVEDCLAWSGKRPVAWLMDACEVDGRWCLIHATHLDEREVEMIAESRAVAGLCPLTEASLGDGIFSGQSYIAIGGRYGIGTDSNIEVTGFGELKQLEYAQRLGLRARNVMAGHAGRSTGRQLYDSACAGAAQALSLPVGKLAPGMRADFVVLDDAHPDLACVSGDRWLDLAIFSIGKAAIREVHVGGKRVVENGRHHARSATQERYMRTLKRLTA